MGEGGRWRGEDGVEDGEEGRNAEGNLQHVDADANFSARIFLDE